MLFENTESTLFTEEEKKDLEVNSSPKSRKTQSKKESIEKDVDPQNVDQSLDKPKKVRRSTKQQKSEETPTLKTNLDFDMLNNMPLASAKNFVSSTKVVDNNGIISYQNQDVKKNKVLESIKRSDSSKLKTNISNENDELDNEPIKSTKLLRTKTVKTTSSVIQNNSSFDDSASSAQILVSTDQITNESSDPSGFHLENEQSNLNVISNNSFVQSALDQKVVINTEENNTDNINLEKTNTQEIGTKDISVKEDNEELHTSINQNSSTATTDYGINNDQLLTAQQDLNNLSTTGSVDDYEASLYNLDTQYSDYNSYEVNSEQDLYNRPKSDVDNNHVLTNGYIRDITPIPGYKSPFINYSCGEEFEQRKARMLDNMDDYGRLSNFEVDLYTTYPNLLPSKTNDFKKNTVQYCKALHELKFEFLFFDTETTGMNTQNSGSKAEGHRIITIGMVPYFDGKLYEEYKYCVDMSFNPEQAIDLEASKVHGIYNSDLVNSGSFADFIPYLKEIVTGKVLCAHNASFDVDFINHELDLANAGWHLEDVCLVIDSLAIARTISNGRASLDALSKRYNINIERTFHGALLDSIILGHVYLAMLNSYQDSMFGHNNSDEFDNPLNIVSLPNFDYQQEYKMANSLVIQLTEEELAAHNKFISSFSQQDKFIEEVIEDDEIDELDEEFEVNLS